MAQPIFTATKIDHIPNWALQQRYLINTSPVEDRRLIIQAGAFGEHQFATVTQIDQAKSINRDINDKYLGLDLPAEKSIVLKLNTKHYRNKPSYEQPI